MEYICLQCLSEKDIHKLVTAYKTIAKCEYCRKKRICISMEQLAEIVDSYFQKYYQTGEDFPIFKPGFEKPDYEQEGDSLEYRLQEELEIEYEPAIKLAQILEDNDPANYDHHCEFFYSSDQNYIRKTISPFVYAETWEYFCELIKHKSRYFDEGIKSLLGTILGKYGSKMARQLPFIEIGPDTPYKFLYRARRVDSENEVREILKNPILKLAPPQPNIATANRMNPTGIPVFYGALSNETAIAEVRPFVGSFVVVGQFNVLYKLKLLDLSRMGEGFTGSIFNADYEDRAARLNFLQRFHALIARPIQPNEEPLEYIPTQAVAEYVSNVLKLDGILYASAQIGEIPDDDPLSNSLHLQNLTREELKSYNIVIFGETPREESDSIIWLTMELYPSLSFVSESINTVEVNGVKYNFEKAYIPLKETKPEF